MGSDIELFLNSVCVVLEFFFFLGYYILDIDGEREEGKDWRLLGFRKSCSGFFDRIVFFRDFVNFTFFMVILRFFFFF